jgi:hypothetical protein
VQADGERMRYTATADRETAATVALMVGGIPVAEDDEYADACTDNDNAEDDDNGDER